MAYECASPDLHDRFKDIRTPLSRDILYHEYGITDHATEYSNQRPFYYLSSDRWLDQVSGENFSDTLYDSYTGMYFIKYYKNSKTFEFELNYDLSSWFTINHLASGLYNPHTSPPIKLDGISPTKKPSERQIYRITDNQPVTAIQYDRDPSGTIYYYIHHDYIAEAHRKWHTESELLQLGYSFTQNYLGLVYNIGSHATSHTSIGIVQY